MTRSSNMTKHHRSKLPQTKEQRLSQHVHGCLSNEVDLQAYYQRNRQETCKEEPQSVASLLEQRIKLKSMH
ncbi:MAG: hypothetical protein ACKO37_01285 [Vampirovibrionales bacterium]